MKRAASVFFLAICLGTALCAGSSVRLFNGLVYYPPRERLTGRILFLRPGDLSSQGTILTNSAVYQLDLASGALSRIAPVPAGSFYVSESGDLLLVIHRGEEKTLGVGKSVYLTMPNLHLVRNLQLECTPRSVTIVGSKVLFSLEGHGHEPTDEQFYQTRLEGQDVEEKIMCYDAVADVLRTIELPGASRWQYQTYDRISPPRSGSHEVLFHYSGHGKRLVPGKDYGHAYYSLDCRTGAVSGPTEPEQNPSDAFEGYLDAATNHIFFLGSEGPSEGLTLARSPVGFIQSKVWNKFGKASVLHRFSFLPALRGAPYVLMQLSPDRRYALVYLEEASRNPKEGFKNTFFVVDTTTGRTSVLLRDETERVSGKPISMIHWVQDPVGH